MMTSHMSNRTTGTTIMTTEEIRRAAPSVFAEAPWGKMSGRYKMVPTIEVIGMLADRGFRPVKAQQSRTRIEGKGDFTKHLVRFRHDDYMTPLAVGAELPELVLTNSHDGTSAYKFMSGIFRLVCLNGLTVQSADHGSISVKHSGGHDFQDRIIDVTYEVIEDAPRTMANIETWKGITLTEPQRQAYAEAAREIRDTTHIQPEQLLSARRRADMGADLWTTTNVVQENVMKGGLRGRNPDTYKRTTTRAVNSVGEDIRLNRALWTLTERMAQLVGA